MKVLVDSIYKKNALLTTFSKYCTTFTTSSSNISCMSGAASDGFPIETWTMNPMSKVDKLISSAQPGDGRKMSRMMTRQLRLDVFQSPIFERDTELKN